MNIKWIFPPIKSKLCWLQTSGSFHRNISNLNHCQPHKRRPFRSFSLASLPFVYFPILFALIFCTIFYTTINNNSGITKRHKLNEHYEWPLKWWRKRSPFTIVQLNAFLIKLGDTETKRAHVRHEMTWCLKNFKRLSTNSHCIYMWMCARLMEKCVNIFNQLLPNRLNFNFIMN